jgi:NADH-quinone oxidoreductase subunit J
LSPAVLYMLYAVLAIGAAGVYLCLPRPGPSGHRLRVAGLIIGLAALAGVAGIMSRWMGGQFVGRGFFVIFAAIALVSAVRVITHPKPVYSALYFILVVLSVSALAVLASASFFAMALVIVYAGAILVTYVFVIMLAQQSHVAGYDKHAREPFAAVTLGFILAAAAGQAMMTQPRAPSATVRRQPVHRLVALGGQDTQRTGELNSMALEEKVGNVRAVGATLLTTYVVAVEVAGVLLLVAMVGAIAIAQKRIEPAALTNQERRELAAVDEDLHRYGRQAPPF